MRIKGEAVVARDGAEVVVRDAPIDSEGAARQ